MKLEFSPSLNSDHCRKRLTLYITQHTSHRGTAYVFSFTEEIREALRESAKAMGYQLTETEIGYIEKQFKASWEIAEVHELFAFVTRTIAKSATYQSLIMCFIDRDCTEVAGHQFVAHVALPDLRKKRAPVMGVRPRIEREPKEPKRRDKRVVKRRPHQLAEDVAADEDFGRRVNVMGPVQNRGEADPTQPSVLLASAPSGVPIALAHWLSAFWREAHNYALSLLFSRLSGELERPEDFPLFSRRKHLQQILSIAGELEIDESMHLLFELGSHPSHYFSQIANDRIRAKRRRAEILDELQIRPTGLFNWRAAMIQQIESLLDAQ